MGGMTSMRRRLLCCVSRVVLCFVHWWADGGMRAFRIGFLRCFPKISGQHCADPRLFAHASLDFHVHVFDLRAGVGRGGWGG